MKRLNPQSPGAELPGRSRRGGQTLTVGDTHAREHRSDIAPMAAVGPWSNDFVSRGHQRTVAPATAISPQGIARSHLISSLSVSAANDVVRLREPDAADYVTGRTFIMDGGLTMNWGGA
jgi:hypothetical protein